MNTQRHVPHKFDLTGLKAGDSFIGCPHCWFQLGLGMVMRPVCPECRGAMRIFSVTPEDVAPNTPMTNEPYDSRPDTLAHIARVEELLQSCRENLEERGFIHDQSKLQEPEKSTFDACTLKLKAMAYGSDEYKAALAELKPALDHHYANNSHHPEYFSNGIDGMSLFDVMEMLMDWKAATERMKGGGDIRRSLEINRDRFKISPQLESILANTIREMCW